MSPETEAEGAKREVNVDLIRRVLAAIEAEPTRWDQSSFFGWPLAETPTACNTTMCLAGWAFCVEMGEEMVLADPDNIDYEEEARRLLGLTPMQAHDLFYAGYHDSLPEYKARIERVLGIKL